MLPNSSEAAWLGIIRIITGAMWLIHGVQKVLNPQFAGPDGMMAGMVRDSMTHASAPYHHFLTSAVLPNAALFGHLVAWGETLTGLSLLLGLFSRLGGLGGMFLTLNYMLMKGSFGELNGYAGLDAATFALSFINLVLPTGMRFGIDGLLFGHGARESAKSPPDWAKS
jgi:uncharacterized membrane protein YphA (DoxX/SURF4 family)